MTGAGLYVVLKDYPHYSLLLILLWKYLLLQQLVAGDEVRRGQTGTEEQDEVGSKLVAVGNVKRQILQYTFKLINIFI